MGAPDKTNLIEGVESIDCIVFSGCNDAFSRAAACYNLLKRDLTMLYCDLSDCPGRIVANGNKFRVQVVCKDW